LNKLEAEYNNSLLEEVTLIISGIRYGWDLVILHVERKHKISIEFLVFILYWFSSDYSRRFLLPY